MRYPAISPALFARQRQRLIARMNEDSVALLHAADQMVRNGDQYFPYRQSSDFFWLTGIEQEKSIILLYKGKNSGAQEVCLFILKPDPDLETWEGKKLDQAAARKISGIEKVFWLDDFDSISRERILKSTSIYCLSREQLKFKPDYPSRDERQYLQLKNNFPLHNYRRLAPLMDSLRLVKEEEEIELIREAIRITHQGLIRVASYLKPGCMEYELEAELTHEFLRRGSGGHAYAPIVASGSNACALHYVSNARQCLDGDLVLMDFGAEYANYAADCSRTLPVNGRFSRRQRQLYDAVLRVFRQSKELIRPGRTIDELNQETRSLWEEEHIRAGLYTAEDLKKQPEDKHLYKQYFPHGLSHFMGLDVHDPGSRQVKLVPGMVLSCEPGIYIPEERTGIRLENDILVTEDGNEDLMESIPMEAEEIEALMNTGG